MPGTPLLLLHGALASSQQFDRFAGMLKDEFEVHMLDFSGHGQRPAKGFGIKQFAQDVLDYLAENKLEKVSIFGYSMGGYVGLYLCAHYPEKIDRLYTLGTKIFWTPEGAAAETGRLDADKMQEKVPAFVEELKARHAHTSWREMLRLTRDMMLSLGHEPELSREALTAITHTICIAVGDKDITVPASEAVEAYQLLPKAQLHILPATPHPFEKVSMELLLPAVKRFFEA